MAQWIQALESDVACAKRPPGALKTPAKSRAAGSTRFTRRTAQPATAAKKIKEVSLKAITLDQALRDTDRLLGEKLEVINSAVVWVPEELTETVAPQIELLGDYAKLYRFQSPREQTQFWAMMDKLTRGHIESIV